ncbi:MAG: diacylglycerol kinase family lipid kinase [Nitrospirota bacterium]|nr:MAG: diacylglycerol kinase family lipid kinase [Nitrospirota bacterium]
MSSSAVLLVNPISGTFNEKNIRIAEDILRKKDYDVEVFLSSKKGEIESLAKGSVEMSPDIVFVMGGDGTFNEAVNGLVHSEVPVAFIPSGTTNVLARELDIPLKVGRAVEMAVNGKVHRISLGKVITDDERIRYFILMAGAGYDAETVYSVSTSLKSVSGKAAYILNGLRVLSRYSPEPITIRTDGDEITGYTVIAGNSSCYGGRLKMTPDASLFSPYLYLYALRTPSRASIIGTLIGMFTGSHVRGKNVSYFRCRSIRLEGSSHVQVDGDHLCRLPIEIFVEKECLNIVN